MSQKQRNVLLGVVGMLLGLAAVLRSNKDIKVGILGMILAAIGGYFIGKAYDKG
jgi:hypothetical protein